LRSTDPLIVLASAGTGDLFTLPDIPMSSGAFARSRRGACAGAGADSFSAGRAIRSYSVDGAALWSAKEKAIPGIVPEGEEETTAPTLFTLCSERGTFLLVTMAPTPSGGALDSITFGTAEEEGFAGGRGNDKDD
jgi:hypothetical protein